MFLGINITGKGDRRGQRRGEWMQRHSGSHSARTETEVDFGVVGPWASVEDVVVEPAGVHLEHHMQGAVDSEGATEEARVEESSPVLNTG